MNTETKTVLLSMWLSGVYPASEWECYGYSEYGFDGVPKFAEIRRIK